MLELYHGSSIEVSNPDVHYGRENLDFGRGFYLTVYRRQAESWAFRKLHDETDTAFLNIYQFDEEKAKKDFQYLAFDSYDGEWLRFIAANRNGGNAWTQYDVVEGGVADDRVIDTVNLYIQSYISEEEAIRRLAIFQPNNQICILSQAAVEECLSFRQSVTIKRDDDTAREILLWGKIGHIITILSERLNIPNEQAMEMFYQSDANKLLHDKSSDLYIMSDLYIADEIIKASTRAF